MNRDTSFVYEVQKKVLADVKLKLQNIERIEYFLMDVGHKIEKISSLYVGIREIWG